METTTKVTKLLNVEIYSSGVPLKGCYLRDPNSWKTYKSQSSWIPQRPFLKERAKTIKKNTNAKTLYLKWAFRFFCFFWGGAFYKKPPKQLPAQCHFAFLI